MTTVFGDIDGVDIEDDERIISVEPGKVNV
jgi:hypothetical protein